MLIKNTIPDFNLTLVINLSDAKGIISTTSYTQNIFVDVSQCRIESTSPISSPLSYTYELNSGQVAFKTSAYF
jgi:hypothetical protein